MRDLGRRRSGIVTFTVGGVAPAEIQRRLDELGVTVSVSTRSSTLIDMTRLRLDDVVRASPHYFVSLEDIDRAVELVERAARG